jgi:hypothetical protein
MRRGSAKTEASLRTIDERLVDAIVIRSRFQVFGEHFLRHMPYFWRVRRFTNRSSRFRLKGCF